MWNKAYKQIIDGRAYIKVHLDFGEVVAIVDQEKKATLPLSALNYLLIYKDDLQQLHNEWVEISPELNWIYGEREKYIGNIIIRNWEGKHLKTIEFSSKANRRTRVTNITVPVKKCNRIRMVNKCTCYDKNNCDYLSCNVCGYDLCWDDPTCIDCDPSQPGGGGANNGPEGDSPAPNDGLPGGAPSPDVYPPQPCYTGQQVQNEDGTSSPPPCTPEPESPDDDPTPMTNAQLLIHSFNLQPNETNIADYINNPANTATVDAISAYLNVNGNTQENIDFAKWAVGYLMANTTSFSAFKDVFLSGPKELTFESHSFQNTTINLSQNDYDQNGTNSFFSENEFDALVTSLSNDFNEDPIELYLLACYRHSKTLNSSTYSKAGNQLKLGDYYLTPHYNSQNQLVFYTASRNQNLGIEYIVKANALNAFKENYTTYKAAADLFYVNGKPSYSQIQMAAGDYWEGLLSAYTNAFSDPYYYLYLGHVFVGTATNLKNVPNTNQPIKYTFSTKKNSRYPNLQIENMSRLDYMDDMATKFQKQWIPEATDPTKSRLTIGNRTYVSVPLSSTEPQPSIYFSKNGKLLGKYRFKN